MKNKLKNIIFALCAILTMPTFVSADVGLLVGRDYGSGNNVDTTIDVTNAQVQFGLARHSYISSTNPTYTWITGTQNGVKRVENSILFFSGHGGQYNMHFYNTDATAGGYNFYITGSADYGSQTVKLTSYNMSKVKLAVFAGCQTGKDSPNIASQTNADGAKATLGWKTSVGAASHTEWLNKFWSKVFNTGLGGTLNTALQYANSFTYNDSRVKNTQPYGNWSVAYNTLSASNNIFDVNMRNTNDILINDERKHNINIDVDKLSEAKKIELIEEYIKNNIDGSFNIKKYNIEKTNSNNYIIYDIIYIIDEEIKTTLGYTVFEINNKIVALYDNTQNVSLDKLTVSSNNLRQTNHYQNISSDSLINTNIYEIENENRYKYYDNKDGKIYYVISLDLLNKSDGTHTVETFKYEI